MKKILSIILFFAPLFVNAQSDVINEVCGVKFGSSLASVKTILNERFGEIYNEEEDMLMYSFQNYGGVEFHFLSFNFVKNGSRTYLNEVVLLTINKTKESAEEQKELIADAVRKTYSLTQLKDSEGNSYYGGGTSPLNPKQYGFYIRVSESNIKEYPWAAQLRYGPYGYGDNF